MCMIDSNGDSGPMIGQMIVGLRLSVSWQRAVILVVIVLFAELFVSVSVSVPLSLSLSLSVCLSLRLAL